MIHTPIVFRLLTEKTSNREETDFDELWENKQKNRQKKRQEEKTGRAGGREKKEESSS